ncbi:hypothetical protein DFJ58DRAFT_772083 [Suillus subalutaceus]|uniref:uncharacterized protein n=1 Tax=Suillus subalutaceus TaxID=48586 RepID=UPI001B866C69|nr:uncharacterized protein DFJ58DRAFT_772083 [Suillus subalutaceus]KAG1865036.1 hypothetical protein DFJ58DRAFT_772083 [Suillus subalutaceus]
MIILVLLTNSLYVPGHLSDAENVIVDVSTSHQGLNCRVDAAGPNSSKDKNCLALLLTWLV